MSTVAQAERAALADLLDRVGPNAPTLCEGWQSQELAAHLVCREGDLLAMPGLVLPPLAPLTERRMRAQLNDGNWTHLIERLRLGNRRFTLSAFPGVDRHLNAVEMFVHHEDVRRAIDPDAEPRALPLAHEKELWQAITRMGRLLLRGAPVGVVLENPFDDAPVRLRPGDRTVAVEGKPSEIALWLTGRGHVAAVTLHGEQDAVQALKNHQLSI